MIKFVFFFKRNILLFFFFSVSWPPLNRESVSKETDNRTSGVSRFVTYSSIESRYFHDKLRIDEIPLKEIQCTMDAHQRVIFQRLVLNYAQHESDIFGHGSGIPLTDGKIAINPGLDIDSSRIIFYSFPFFFFFFFFLTFTLLSAL